MALPTSIENQRMRFEHDRVRREQRPAFGMRLPEQTPRCLVVRVLSYQVRVPPAAADQNALHFSSAYAAARCLYLSLETSVKSEWPVPAWESHRSRPARGVPAGLLACSSARPCSSESMRLRRSSGESVLACFRM